MLPLPVRGLDPLLNGRNLQLRLESSAPVSLATLAAFGRGNEPPAASSWAALLEGGLSPREHSPTPRGSKGGMVYSRVSGVQVGGGGGAIEVEVFSADGSKCERCWKHSEAVGKHTAHPTLCGRCAGVVSGIQS